MLRKEEDGTIAKHAIALSSGGTITIRVIYASNSDDARVFSFSFASSFFYPIILCQFAILQSCMRTFVMYVCVYICVYVDV